MKRERSAFAGQASVVCLFLGVAAACGGSSSSGGEAGAAGKSSAGAAGSTGGAGAANAGAVNAGAANAGAANGGMAGGHAGGGAGVSGAGAAGSSGACSPACGPARECCAGQCVNVQNDPHNCGVCGLACEAGTYCGSGQCVQPACDATCTGNTCCGTGCCTAEELCCDAQGPIDNGPHCVTPSASGTCPMGCAPACVCAAPDTPIATPDGERAIASLRVGDLVYSVDGSAVRPVPIMRVKQTGVTRHHVMRVQLATGVTLEISGGHPTADGRSFADLRVGSLLDGLPVISAEKVPYSYASTYDILPASSSGTYFAAGALIGSTIDRAAASGSECACVGAP